MSAASSSPRRSSLPGIRGLRLLDEEGVAPPARAGHERSGAGAAGPSRRWNGCGRCRRQTERACVAARAASSVGDVTISVCARCRAGDAGVCGAGALASWRQREIFGSRTSTLPVSGGRDARGRSGTRNRAGGLPMKLRTPTLAEAVEAVFERRASGNTEAKRRERSDWMTRPWSAQLDPRPPRMIYPRGAPDGCVASTCS